MAGKLTTSYREARQALREFDQRRLCSNSNVIPKKALVAGVPEELIEKLGEKFHYIRMDYDYTTGEIFVIKVFYRDIWVVRDAISFQFSQFAKENDIFVSGGGSKNITTFENGRKVRRDVQPDAVLYIHRNVVSHNRVVAEIDDGHGTFGRLDARMRYMMTGWAGCLIGIGFKFFPQSKNSRLFRAISFLYYKRNNAIELDKVLDVGTESLKNDQVATIRSHYGIEVIAPENHSRCYIVPHNFNPKRIDLITNDQAFYQVQLDTSLLYAGANAKAERHDLVIDFLRVVRRLTLKRQFDV